MALKPAHYVMWNLAPGGIELSVNHYIRHFAGQRELNAFSLRTRENTLYDETKIRIDSGGTVHSNLKIYRRYFAYCRRHRKDVFHLLYVGPVIVLISLLAGVRNPVYHIHGTIHWKSAMERWYVRTMWFLVSFFKVSYVANSGYSAGIFRRHALPVQAKVIYNGLDTRSFLEKRSLRTRLRKIGYAGRLEPGKNVDLVIRLFEEVAARQPGVELYIAGEGSLLEVLKARAARSPYRDQIHFPGFIRDIASFYASMDLFLFLSAYESFGNVLAEALLTGLPVLTSNVPVFREIYGDDGVFELGAPADYDGVRERLLAAIGDFPGLARKAIALSDRLGEIFSVEQHVSQIESLYELHP